jgi:hypothetical protein
LAEDRKQPLFEKSGAKTFVYAGPGALAATMPMTQMNKVFLLLFVHKKKPTLSPGRTTPVALLRRQTFRLYVTPLPVFHKG